MATETLPTGTPDQQNTVSGPRQTGVVETPSGQTIVREVTPDGMKQTKFSGERYGSAADFHRQAGVAQPGEQVQAPTERRAKGLLGKLAFWRK